MSESLLLIHNETPHTYEVGELVICTEYLESDGLYLPAGSICKIIELESKNLVRVEPVEIDIDDIYEDLQGHWEPDDYYDEEDYCDQCWEEAEYRADEMYSYSFEAYLDELEKYCAPKPVEPVTPKKKSRLHNLGILLRKKTRGLIKKVSGFFKKVKSKIKKKDLPGITGETFTIKLDQAWSGANTEVDPYPVEYRYTITNTCTTIRQSEYPTTTTQWVDTGMTL